ncbi:unnamed protein product [Hymenolepis diminuta]|uniref:Protein kinase domain-containing protein n=1 Tax=Hymenolepis diminuta TaxID=6216 RepID=A0A564YNS6_HYMDI|nr:unnamed protein product [Hymenolepis diminuta]
MAKAKSPPKKKHEKSSKADKQSLTHRGRSTSRCSKTTFIEVNPKSPYCYTHKQYAPCNMENCQLKPIPAKLAKNCRGELFLITKPEKCSPRSGSSGKCIQGRPRSYGCPCCVQKYQLQKQQPVKRYENSSNSDICYTTTTSSDETSEGRADYGDVRLVPVQQNGPRSLVSSPPRTLPTQRDSNSETEIALKPGENVKIVYETRPINGNARENEQRRSKSAAQPTIRVGRDYSPARINGASKILYATEPETNDYPNVQISRSSYTNAGERQDVTVTTTTESISTDGYPNHKPSYGFVVDPQFPERRGNNHEVTKRDGENGIGFESSRPSGIPYFDYGSDNNIDTNVNGMRRERNDVYLETSYLTSGPAPNMRIQGRTIRSDNSTYLPNDTPLGGVALDDTLETVDSLTGRLASGDLISRTPIELLAPNFDEGINQSRTDLNNRHDPIANAESAFSSHAYEVVRDTDSYSTQRTSFEMPVPTSAAVAREEIKSHPPPPPLNPGPPSESPPSHQIPVIPKPPLNKLEPKARLSDPLSNNEANRGNSFDLMNMVSIQVGSLIQQRLRELSAQLRLNEQPPIPKKLSANPGTSKLSTANRPQQKETIPAKLQQGNPTARVTKAPSLQSPTRLTQVTNKQFEYVDTFIDRQFRGVDKKSPEQPKTKAIHTNIELPSVTQKDSTNPTYENISRNLKNGNLINKQVKQNGVKGASQQPAKKDTKTPLSEPSALVFNRSIQPEQLIVQRVKELMGRGSETRSLTSGPIAYSPAEQSQIRPRFDDFRLVAVLGQGNFGKVLLAEHKPSNAYMALKTFKKVELLRDDNVDTLKIEKRVLLTVSQARHPCFVHMLACMQQPDYAVIVLEYMPGGDLMQHIQRGKFSEQQTAFYAASVILGLEFLHDNNIMYRDLKLENLLLTLKGYLKLLDFGLCKEGMGPNDRTDTFCGTPEFVAPEMITGNGYTRAIDWWCLGVLIYEMIVGKCPFAGATDQVLYNNIIRQEPRIPPNVSAKTTDIIKRFMQKNPAQRLGAIAGGSTAIKTHPFFADTDFEGILMQRVKPPFMPKIRNIEDVSNFDTRYTKTVPRLSMTDRSLSPRDDMLYFADFDFY